MNHGWQSEPTDGLNDLYMHNQLYLQSMYIIYIYICVCKYVYIYIYITIHLFLSSPLARCKSSNSPRLPFLFKLPPGFVQFSLHLADGDGWDIWGPRDSIGFLLLIYDR